jgi:hypothetical protein
MNETGRRAGSEGCFVVRAKRRRRGERVFVCEKHAFDAQTAGGAAGRFERAFRGEAYLTRQKHGTRILGILRPDFSAYWEGCGLCRFDFMVRRGW